MPATTANGTFLLPTGSLPNNSPNGQLLQDGQYILTALATDGAGHNATAMVTVSIDHTAPTITITTPAPKAVLRVLTTIGGRAPDAVGGTGTRQVLLTLVRISDSKYWNGTAFVIAPKVHGVAQPPTFSANVDTSNGVWARRSGLPSGANLTPGNYRILAIAIDGAGNRGQATSSFEVPPPFQQCRSRPGSRASPKTMSRCAFWPPSKPRARVMRRTTV